MTEEPPNLVLEQSRPFARSRRAPVTRLAHWPRAWFPYGRSVRPAIAQTRRLRYSHSCVEPSLWLRRHFHKPRPGFETHLRRSPSNGIDKATLAAPPRQLQAGARATSLLG